MTIDSVSFTIEKSFGHPYTRRYELSNDLWQVQDQALIHKHAWIVQMAGWVEVYVSDSLAARYRKLTGKEIVHA